jgi:myosin heavy subunit
MAENSSPDAGFPSVNQTDAKVEEADFTAVVFHGVLDVYAPEKDVECCYTIKPSVKPSKRDWVGLFKVGWQSFREHYTYEWSPFIEGSQEEEAKPIANRVIFRAKYLPKCDEEFYQFCYFTNSGEVRGASVPFQIKTKCDETEFEFCEVEDDESMVMIKNRTAILEESLSRALEENTSLKVSNERKKNELETLSDTIMFLEKRKSELTAQVNHERKQNTIIAKELDAVNKRLIENNKELGMVGNRMAELETTVKDLETNKQELMVILEHANKKAEESATVVEKEQLQCTEAQKSRDKLVSEKLQYLQKIAENRELVQNLSSDVNKKAQEISTVKGEKDNLNLVIVKLKQDLDQKGVVIKNVQDEVAAGKDTCLKIKSEAENEAAKSKEELKTLLKKLEVKNTELTAIKDTVLMLTTKVKSLEKEKDVIMDAALSEATGFESKVKGLLEERQSKEDEIHGLEYELEDLKTKIELEKGRNLALEEDYEAVLRGLENQIEGEKALNKSLCTHTDNTVSDLQEQLEHQLEVNAEQSRVMESKTAEAKEALEELEKGRNQMKSYEERLKVAFAQLSAADDEVKSLKCVKESLQTSLNDTKGKNQQSSKNSAASMYALQTAHAHLEKKYFEAKKKLEDMWKEKNEYKRALAAIQSGLPASDLRHEIEQFLTKNEDLRVRLNMGAEAYKSKFIECRRLQNQLKKLQRSPCESVLDSSLVSKLQEELEEERSAGLVSRKALETEKQAVQQKNQELEEVRKRRNFFF